MNPAEHARRTLAAPWYTKLGYQFFCIGMESGVPDALYKALAATDKAEYSAELPRLLIKESP